jgi:hypothetical protein
MNHPLKVLQFQQMTKGGSCPIVGFIDQQRKVAFVGGGARPSP